MNNLELIKTNDGSHTIYVPSLNETYHSNKGAVSESRYVFIEQGLNYFSNKKQPERISVMEVGFGTGLNAILTYGWFHTRNLLINYQTIEPNPLSPAFIKKLNYTEYLENKALAEIFFELHNCEWDGLRVINAGFQFIKYKKKLEQLAEPAFDIDIVFFDAFAPGKQSEIWAIENLQKLYEWMKEGGILVTYCAQGAFRRNLIQTGFKVERIPGPLGKKEMIRAQKT